MMTDSSEDLNLSFVLDESDASTVVEKLHTRLFAARGNDPRLGPTWDMLRGTAPRSGAPGRVWWRDRVDALRKVAQDGPAYVYHIPTVIERAERLRRSLSPVGRFYYAMKANAHPRILEAVAECGFGLECVSAAEVRRVREVLGDACPVLFTPNFCPLEEYAIAFEAGAEVVLDGPAVLDHAPGLFKGRAVGLRIDPGRGHGHHEKVRTAGSRSKFGHPLAHVEALREAAERASVRVTGLHAHVGSGILDPDAWRRTGDALREAMPVFPETAWLNVGGGLGVPEVTGGPELDLDVLRTGLSLLREAAGPVEIRMEPGRYLVSEAGVLLARVTQVREKDGVRFAGLETGMNSLIRPALYGAWHSIHNLDRLDDPATAYWQIVGPICETGDILGHDRWISDPRPGDVMLIENGGAYGAVMSSRYNLREPAREVILD
jgi:diaminopimelate decarboxylase/aspartate kinase